MKMVTIHQGETESDDVRESELSGILDNDSWKTVGTKSQYELVRQQHSSEEKSWRIIYQKNKRERTMTNWMTPRVIQSLQGRFPDLGPAALDYSVQVSGLDLTSSAAFGRHILLEVVYRRLSTHEIIYYDHKREAADADLIILICQRFTGSFSRLPDTVKQSVRVFEYEANISQIMQYYSRLELPSTLADLISSRHVRYLMTSGHWRNQQQVFQPKHRSSQLLRRDIATVSSSKRRQQYYPLKIYWSLDRMIDPVAEFKGKGEPKDRVLAAFDIDGKHLGPHTINQSTLCGKCIGAAEQNLIYVEQKLDDLGFAKSSKTGPQKSYRIYFSGSRGFHIYLLGQDGKPLEISQKTMQGMIGTLTPYVDPFLSVTTGEFDRHRIFKVPHTVDISTGIVVDTKFRKFPVLDILRRID